MVFEDTYHYSDFDRLKNKKRIGEVLAICPKHAHLKLTSNFNKDTLSDDAKLIIVEIKAIRKEVIQKEILDGIATVNNTTVTDAHNATIFDNNNNSEIENLKIERTLLRELNTATREKLFTQRTSKCPKKSKFRRNI